MSKSLLTSHRVKVEAEGGKRQVPPKDPYLGFLEPPGPTAPNTHPAILVQPNSASIVPPLNVSNRHLRQFAQPHQCQLPLRL
jgi:hypothetical protein